MQFWKQFKHCNRHNEHCKQGNDTRGVRVPKFKHTKSEVLPTLVRTMHPDKASIAKQVEDVDNWDGE